MENPREALLRDDFFFQLFANLPSMFVSVFYCILKIIMILP